MPLIKPEVTRALFDRSQLTLVVCQIQFEPILAIGQPNFIAAFQEAIRGEYPGLARVGSVELLVGPDGIGAKPTEASGWAFDSQDGRTVVLDANSMALEVRSYRTFDDLRKRFADLLTTLLETIKPGERTRLGLRYINQIRFDDASSIGAWRSLVRPELLGLAFSPELATDETIKHTLGQTRLAEEDSQLVARYGFLPAGVVMPGAPPAETPYFLLDLDEFDVRHFPTIEPEAALQQLDSFHGDIHRAFRWALMPEGAARLGLGDEITSESHA